MAVLALMIGATVWTPARPYALPLVWCSRAPSCSHLIVPAWTIARCGCLPAAAGAALAWPGSSSTRAGAGRAPAPLRWCRSPRTRSCVRACRHPQRGLAERLAVAEADVGHDPAPERAEQARRHAGRERRSARSGACSIRAPRAPRADLLPGVAAAGFYERQNRLTEARQAFERATVVDPTRRRVVGLALLDSRPSA